MPIQAENPVVPIDPYLWLEDLTSESVMDWVRTANARTFQAFENEEFAALEDAILHILDSKAKIPHIAKHGAYFYNFWRDAEHLRGIWRRATLEEYRKPEPAWELVLDLDMLAREENQPWVFRGAKFLKPDCRICLVSLSPGGSDAVEIREFDVERKSFVAGGFQVPLAKTETSWIDPDTLFVGTDFGPGSMTESGYPRIVKRWKRGTPICEARTIFEGQNTDMAVGGYHDSTPGFERDFLYRRSSFFTGQMFLLERDGTIRHLDLPEDAEPDVHRDWMIVRLRTPWTVGQRTYPSGALIGIRFEDFVAGERSFSVLFEPTPSTSLESTQWTRDHLILNVMEDVKSRLSILAPQESGWQQTPIPETFGFSNLSVRAVDADESNDVFLTATDFLTPDSLLMGNPATSLEILKAMPAFFDASGLEIHQFFAISEDGTRIPYFQVARENLSPDGTHPTLLLGYGGFEVSERPYYSGVAGQAWLNTGGVLALANIRGGGEYGPAWHQAALKQNRHRSFEDFAAVAKDLSARGITSPAHLGILGGSNGGLLVGNMLTRYPALFGAIVCQVPLLDMQRYSHLLAGASWMDEYGDPDKPEEWAFIRTFSPYHNVATGQPYPPVLFMTTTLDDRVHPAHARKMFAKMQDLGYDVHYFENTEGGHGAGADNRQTARFWALAYAFLTEKLK